MVMSVNLILSGSWSPYEEYKICKAQNPDIFLPTDPFEIDFLVQKINLHYPQYSKVAIELSVNNIRRTLYAGCKRSLFVDLVINNLLQRQSLPLI